MKRLLILLILIAMFSSVAYADLSDAKQKWLDAKAYHEQTKIEWREAQQLVNLNNTPENVQNVIAKAKVSLNAGLDAAIAFFEFHKEKLEAEDISDSLKSTIRSDIDKNIGVAEGLKLEVDAIDSRLEVGIVSLKIFDKYLNLLVDIMRDTGLAYIEKSNGRYDRLSEMRTKLESKIPESRKAEFESALNDIDNHLKEAKANIDNAEAKYKSIIQKQGSGIAFAEGNKLLLEAHKHGRLALEGMKTVVVKLRG